MSSYGQTTLCPYCNHSQARISKNKDGFVIRCSYCREFLAGFDTVKEALIEWNQLPLTISSLAKSGHIWDGNGMCHPVSKKRILRGVKKTPLVNPQYSPSSCHIQGADFENTICSTGTREDNRTSNHFTSSGV